MQPVLRVGCPMWANRVWVGRFYPVGTAPGTELEAYARWCNAVEGNTTFYAEPTADTVARWCRQAPDDFRFAFKLPRTITHDKRLRDVAVEVRSFLDVIEPLGDRVGPLQIQLPPSLGPTDLEVLLAFMRRLPAERRWSVELRHQGFFDGSTAHRRIDAWLEEHGHGRVVLDTRPLAASDVRSAAALEEMRTKPLLPICTEAAGPHPIVRLIGEDRSAATLDGLLAWVPQVTDWLREGRRPYVFVHQPDNIDSPGLARAFHEAVATEVTDLAPLPDPTTSPDQAGQTALF